MAAFDIILMKGISIGIVLGVPTSRVACCTLQWGKGVAMGLATGAIAYFVIYVPP
jgi:hypothetical protein